MNGDLNASSPPKAEHWLDSLSKALAHGISRRAVMKLLVGGIIGGATGGAVRVAFGSNLFTKPASRRAPSLCEERISNGTPPSSDGCGGTFSSFALNHYGKADFTPACNALDECYSTCNKSKADCDNEFANNLSDICDAAYGGFFGSPSHDITGHLHCAERARLYYNAVDKYGDGDYEDAQSAVCTCCAGVNCDGVCCDAGEECCDGKCCPAGETCCGNGICSIGCQSGYYCPCNKKTYSDLTTCKVNCQEGLGCFGQQCVEVS